MRPAMALLGASGLFDEANDRSSHTGTTLRGGGVSPLLAGAAALAVGAAVDQVPNEVLSTGTFVVMFGVLGLVDDFRDLPPLPRLIAQILLAAGMVTPLEFEIFGLADSAARILGIVWVVGFVNVFNFMDGINGISATTATLSGTVLAFMSWANGTPQLGSLAALVAGASVGFAPFNVPQARVFLGDVGSYTFGSALAGSLLLLRTAEVSLIFLVLPFALYLSDTSYTMIRRLRRRESLVSAHREHTYQLMVQAGMSHVKTSAIVGFFTTILCGLALAGQQTERVFPAAVAGMLVCASYLAGGNWHVGRVHQQ